MEYVRCNLCDSDKYRLLFKQPDTLTSTTDFEFPVVRCKECGLVYVNPRPTIDEIGAFYPKNFVSYQFELYGLQKGSTHRQRVISSITTSISRNRVTDLSSVITLDKDTKVLDIGCGKGAFLYYLSKTYGCNCTGIDFDHDSVQYCNESLGLNVLEGGIDIIDTNEDKFDLITMWHYLEHEYNPLSSLHKAFNHLEKNGLLVIEVPNAESLENKIFTKHSYLYDVPRHLYHFSPSTMTRYLKSVGLVPINIFFPSQSGGWLGTAQNIMSNGSVYKNMCSHAYLLMAFGALTFPIDFITSKTSGGSILRIYAKK